jgi:hypothetical protein
MLPRAVPKYREIHRKSGEIHRKMAKMAEITYENGENDGNYI